MLSVRDVGHINNIFLMKTTSFNAGEGYITALTKSNIFVMTNAYVYDIMMLHQTEATSFPHFCPVLPKKCLFCQTYTMSTKANNYFCMIK